ncbi:MAG: insulinase family protein [Termitinemataceae bacterium]|nr:MAG: insulinase family protein [Termitinemataceae bacterium]
MKKIFSPLIFTSSMRAVTLARNLRAILLVVALLFSFTSMPLVAASNDGNAIPFMNGVRHGKLQNGLTYYILENKKPENRAFFSLAVNAGSVLEAENQRGLAHLLEHMAFNGTTRFPESDLVEYLRSLGMRFGADLNAYTSYDETVYELEVPTEIKNGVKTVPQKAIDILDDWTRAIILNEKDVADERLVVMEEYRLRLGAANRLRKFLFPRLFGGSQYAQREPIGLAEVIQNAPVSRLKDFYTKWYVPSNMAIIIVGDFNGGTLEKQLQASFNNSKTSTGILENVDPNPQYFLPDPVSGKRQYEVFVDPELTETSVILFYKHKWEPYKNDIALFKTDTTDMIISIILAERFNEAAQQPQTPFITADSGWIRYVRNSLHWSLDATAKQGRSKDALKSILQTKESVSRYGFTDAEIDRAKKTMLTYFENAYNERAKKNSKEYVQLFVNNFLENQYASSAEWDLKTGKKILPTITNKNLIDRFNYYISPNDLFVFVYAPSSEAATLPTAAEVEKILSASAQSIIEQKVDMTFTDELLDSIPVKGAITEEFYDKKLKLTHWTLSNGAKVIVNETKNKNDQIMLYAAAKGGFTSVSAQDIVSARLTSEMLSASGLGNWTLADLHKKISGKQVSYSFNISPFSRNVQAASNTKDKKTLFEMIYLSFTNPTIQQDAVNVLIDKYKTLLPSRKLNPESYFRDELTKLEYAESPYFMPLEVSDLSRINISRATSFAKKCTNAGDWVFVFTGNVKPKDIRAFTETYIASIPSKDAFNEWAYLDLKIAQGVTKNLYKGKEAKSLFYSGRIVKHQWNEKENLTTAVLTEYMDIVMIQEIREKLGGVYSISANTSISMFPPSQGKDGDFGVIGLDIYFGCDPKRAQELNTAVELQLKKIADGDINKETFEKARLALIKSSEQSMQNNLYLSTVMANRIQIYNAPLEDIYNRAHSIRSITENDMQNIMRLVMAVKPFVVILNPEN